MATTTTGIGARIKDRREQAGLTQAQLAEKSGVTQGHLSQIETGAKVPSLGTLRKLRDALELDDETWLDWIDAA